MKTNIKKNYQKSIASDGTITLTFRQTFDIPFNAMPIAMLIGFIAIVMLVCGVGLANASTPDFTLLWVDVLIGIATVVLMLKITKGAIVIKPNAGIIVGLFGRRKIAFSDIPRFTIIHEGNTSAIRAQVHGSDVPVTRWVGNALARALLDEIIEASGRNWDDVR